MPKFPKDASRARVLRTLKSLGFQIVREKEHISMTRQNEDGTETPLTLPNHRQIKASTLRSICTQANILREDFLQAYDEN